MSRAHDGPPSDPFAVTESWLDGSQQTLAVALRRVRDLLEAHLDRGSGHPRRTGTASASLAPESNLGLLQRAFGLTPFEVDVLLLCAGVELDGALAALCGAASGPGGGPTFALALEAFPGADWGAVTSDAPLRRWCLVVPVTPIGSGPLLTRTPLRVDEWVLHFLVGLEVADPLLAGRVRHRASPGTLPAGQERVAGLLADRWSAPDPGLVVLRGDPREVQDVAARAAALVGAGLRLMHGDDVPGDPPARHVLATAVVRDGRLGGGPLLLRVGGPGEFEADRGPEHGSDRVAGGLRWLADVEGARAVAGLQGSGAGAGPDAVEMTVPGADAHERSLLWAETLLRAGAPVPAPADLDGVVEQFRLPGADIERAAYEVAVRGVTPWAAARARARHRLSSLAVLVETDVGWDDLVLPDDALAPLRQLQAQVRHRTTVLREWGMGRASGMRGHGVSALFAGASGTGKTLAAEVVARTLELDLWRIDLSQVVSKYIGETEKNLGEIFRAADLGGCVLLFDEADALFGKRTEVKDSHDRYANLEVSHLLQLMEGYRGLAVLTTNLRDNLDHAFLRRLQFVVTFPFPDREQRRAIWRRQLAGPLPTRDIDHDALADLALPGGALRNIALGAAYLAAAEGGPVTMDRLLRSARQECAKLERPLGAAEVERWVTAS